MNLTIWVDTDKGDAVDHVLRGINREVVGRQDVLTGFRLPGLSLEAALAIITAVSARVGDASFLMDPTGRVEAA